MIKCHLFNNLLRRDVAWNHRRLFITEAAREVPVTRKSGKKVPKAVRKAMVDDYVKRYRASNAGKFPGVTNITSEVGGGHYTISSILQELKHSYRLSEEVTANNNSVVGQPSLRNDISSVKEIVDSATVDNGSSDKIVTTNQIVEEKTSPEILDADSSMDNSKVYEESNIDADGRALSSTVSVVVNKSSQTKNNAINEMVSASDTITELEFEKRSTVCVEKVRSNSPVSGTNLVNNSAVETVNASEPAFSSYKYWRENLTIGKWKERSCERP